MIFKENNKAIFLQIADTISDDILAGKLNGGDRLPSVRDYAASVEVNPNTVMRTYDRLSTDGIIFNRRGIGYFVTDDARRLIVDARRRQLLDHELDEVFHSLSLLGITSQELKDLYQNYLTANSTTPR